MSRRSLMKTYRSSLRLPWQISLSNIGLANYIASHTCTSSTMYTLLQYASAFLTCVSLLSGANIFLSFYQSRKAKFILQDLVLVYEHKNNTESQLVHACIWRQLPQLHTWIPYFSQSSTVYIRIN